jgi:hypothetical protein
LFDVVHRTGVEERNWRSVREEQKKGNNCD